jgi:hypothetical protein
MSTLASRTVLTFAAANVAAALFVPSALGQCDDNYYWIGGYGSWFSPDNWYHEEWDPNSEECFDDDTIPGSDDWARVWSGNPYISGVGATCDGLDLGSQLGLLPGGSLYVQEEWVDGSVVQTGGLNDVGWYLHVGNSAYSFGTYEQQGGIVNTDGLGIAAATGSQGRYELSAGGELWTSGAEQIGFYGDGTFIQTGGSNSCRWANIGLRAGSSGAYLQSGGLLMAADRIFLGSEPNSDGTYELSGAASVSAPRAHVGFLGAGTFTQTGGTANFAEGLAIGGEYQGDPGGNGSYSLEGGELSTGSLDIATGPDSNGTFAQTGGECAASFLNVANGLNSVGTFVQAGGTNTIARGIAVAGDANSEGKYELSGNPSVVVLSAQWAMVGRLGMGTFIQTGGSVNLEEGLSVGGNYQGQPGGCGSYSLQGGELSVESLNVAIGPESNGTFVQAGGTNTVTEWVELGRGVGSDGTYELSGDPNTVALSADKVHVGHTGEGTFVQSGGRNTLTEGVAIGLNAGSEGRYELSSTGTLSVLWETIGAGGTGVFTQIGGTNTVTGTVAVGLNAGSHGTYELTGTGTLSALWETIGAGGTGVFTQIGGTNTIGESLALGVDPGSDGTYEFNAGVVSVNENAVIGHEGVGIFRQSNGTFTVGGVATGIGLGGLSGSDGRLELSGGTLTVSSWMAVGQGGAGTVIVNGPTASLDVPYLEVGHQTGTGTVNIQASGASILARTLVLGAQSTFSAVSGASIRLTTGAGSFENYSTDEVALGGLHNLNLVCDGDPRYLEVSGYDDGVPSQYCWFDQIPNFQIGLLTVNGVLHLVDEVDNGNRGGTHGWHEALYVDDLTTETGGIIYTHGLHIYIGCDDPFAYPWICPGTGCGDFDRDCDADSADLVDFISCLSGPDVPIGPECNAGDCDADGDVDLTDFAQFQVAFTGS